MLTVGDVTNWALIWMFVEVTKSTDVSKLGNQVGKRLNCLKREIYVIRILVLC